MAGGAGLPWKPFAGDPPAAVNPGPWVFFTPEEGAAVEALVDRLIPPDPETPGGKVADARSSLTASWPALTGAGAAST